MSIVENIFSNIASWGNMWLLCATGFVESYLSERLGVIFVVNCPWVGPQDEKSSNLHITADSTGSIHKNARGKKFDPKKVRLGCGDLI